MEIKNKENLPLYSMNDNTKNQTVIKRNVKKYFEELSNKKDYLPKKIKANKTEIGNWTDNFNTLISIKDHSFS